MAKTSMIERDKKRRRLAKKYKAAADAAQGDRRRPVAAGRGAVRRPAQARRAAAQLLADARS